MSDLWTIELFGGLTAVHRGERVIRFATLKTASLLAYLAYYRSKTHQRETVSELLWPDSDPAQGRSRLSTLLSYLRNLLEPSGIPSGSVLISDRNSLRLNPDLVVTDCMKFENLIHSAEKEESERRGFLLEEAISLYGAGLLPGCYEEWAIQEQEKLGKKFITANLLFSEYLEKTGNLEDALQSMSNVARYNAYSEEASRGQMRILAKMGRSGEAMEVFSRLEIRLKEEFDILPDRETRSLCDEIRRNPAIFKIGRRAVAQTSIPVLKPAMRAGLSADDSKTTPLKPLPASESPSFQSNLPPQMTRFFGREHECEQLQGWLNDSNRRLITITGPGGTGKTRLAIETSANFIEKFQGRVWFVDLTRISDPILLPFAIVQAIGIQSGQTNPLEQAIQKLRESPSLLLFDNFEHLMREPQEAPKIEPTQIMQSSTVVKLLLERVPDLTCIVTSRQALRLGIEQELPLKMLPLPEEDWSAEALMRNSSVALYLDRAKSVRPDFAITPKNAMTVATLCRKLEGAPLALEMAAAWAKLLSPAKMLERLSDRLESLVSRRKDVPERHHSIRETIEWSYSLLPSHLQDLFDQLSVFRGGWTMESAQAVCRLQNEGEQELSPDDLFERMAELLDRSLIVAEERDDEIRYRFLESVREFALEKLSSRSVYGEQIEKFSQYFATLAENVRTNHFTPQIKTGLKLIEEEYDNLRCALEIGADSELKLRLGSALYTYWRQRGYFQEGRRWLEAILDDSPDAPEKLRTNVMNHVGVLAYLTGDSAAATNYLNACLEYRRNEGDVYGVGSTLTNFGAIAYRCGDYEIAETRFAEALEIFRSLDHKVHIATNLNNLCVVATDLGNLNAAKVYCEEALGIRLALGDQDGVAQSMAAKGVLMISMGQYQNAYERLNEALEINRTLGDQSSESFCLYDLGLLRFAEGEIQQAHDFFDSSLQLTKSLHDMKMATSCRIRIAKCHFRSGNPELGTKILAETVREAEELKDRQGRSDIAIAMGEQEIEGGRLSHAQRQFAEAMRLQMEMGTRVGMLDCVYCLAKLAFKKDAFVLALKLLSYEQKSREEIGNSIFPIYRHEREALFASIRNGISLDEFNQAWIEGAALEPDLILSAFADL